jgi:hypothetical protein
MIDPEMIGTEQRAALEKEILRDFILIQIKTYVDSVASIPAIDELTPHINEAGQMFADSIVDLYEIKGDDLNKIDETSNLFEEFLGIDHHEMEKTREKIIRVGGSKCPWREGQMEACMAVHEIFLNGICSKINPEFQCRFTQMITKGDPICCWILEKKEP